MNNNIKDDISILKETIRLAIVDVDKRNKTFLKQIKESMVFMYNVPVGDTVDIVNGKLPVEGMDLDTLYKVSNVLYKLYKTNKLEGMKFDLNKLNPELYFNDTQIKKFSNKIQEQNLIGDIVFDKYLQLNTDQYLVTAPIDEVIKWRDARRIKYNEKTQRKMTIREVNGEEVKSVTLNKNARSEIHKLMENNEFISNALTLNIDPDYNDPPYISKNDKLVIPAESEIDISDGFHRYLEMTSVKDENKDWKYNTAFYITIFDEKKSNKFIWQEDHKNHLEKEQLDTMNKSDDVNYLLDRLNESDSFHWKGSLTSDKLYILNKAIHNLFEDKNNKIDRPSGIKLFKTIESNINLFIEENDLYFNNATKKEWFIYITVLNYCIKNDLKFINLINKIDLKSLEENLDIVNDPKPKHYKIMNDVLSEVIGNV